MSKPIEGGQFQPELKGRYHFKWQGQEIALVEMKLMPGTAPVMTIMAPCHCGAEDCNGYNQIPLDPMQGMAVMGKAIMDLLDERDAREAQNEPGVN